MISRALGLRLPARAVATIFAEWQGIATAFLCVVAIKARKVVPVRVRRRVVAVEIRAAVPPIVQVTADAQRARGRYPYVFYIADIIKGVCTPYTPLTGG